MTTSDIERTLAEARAAATRRLQSLKRAEGMSQQAEAATEPEIVARREPAPSVGGPVEAFSRVPPEQMVHISPPPTVDLRVAAPEPSIAHAPPVHRGQPAGAEFAGQQNPIEASYRLAPEPAPGPEYVPVDPISRRLAEAVAPPVQYSAAPEYAEPPAYAEAPADDIRRDPGFLTKLLAGVAAFRRSRAERRARAQAEAATVQPRRQALTAKERRWERRRKRYIAEEILGWILVPIILVAIYFLALWILDLFGTTPETLIEGIQTIWHQFR
jgi:hypothetical protein